MKQVSISLSKGGEFARKGGDESKGGGEGLGQKAVAKAVVKALRESYGLDVVLLRSAET